MSPDELRRFSILSGLDDATLTRLAAATTRRRFAPGEVLIQEGRDPACVFLIQSGEVDILRGVGGDELWVRTAGEGEIMGEISLLQGSGAIATVRAATEVEALSVPGDEMLTLLSSPEVVRRMVATLVPRLRETERRLEEQAKLAALGTVAAGLLHEINNPAAAVARLAGYLAGVATDWRESLSELVGESLTPPEGLGSLQAATRAGEVADRLDQLGAEAAVEHASDLVAAGFTVTHLERLFERVGAVGVNLAAALVGAGAVAAELRVAAGRISDVLSAVRRYTAEGRPPVQRVDVAASIGDTLTILAHKRGEVEVVTHLDDLGEIDAYGGELSQVWSNLIDNAYEAMEGSGRLTVTGRRLPGRVRVTIADTGPGIPPELRHRVLDPFVTSKPVGSGLGLGLSIVDAVVRRHGGTLSIDSDAEGTRVTVEVPDTIGSR